MPDHIIAKPGKVSDAYEDLRTDWPPLSDSPPSQRKHPLPPSMMTDEQLPESWQPKNGGAGDPARVTSTASDEPTWAPDSIRYGVEGLPGVDMDDPGQVEAWFAPGSYSHYEHFRKCVLAQCKELVRAKYNNTRISEARIEDLARLHGNYMEYLTDSLYGRQMRETLVRQRMGA
jgi:hypothetical protein